MSLDDVWKGINKAVFKEFPNVSEFLKEIEKGGIDHAQISVELKRHGEAPIKGDAPLGSRVDIDSSSTATSEFHIVGEAFGPSGEKVASFREIMPGFMRDGEEKHNERMSLFVARANLRLIEISARIKEIVFAQQERQRIRTQFASPSPAPEVITVPYIYTPPSYTE